MPFFYFQIIMIPSPRIVFEMRYTLPRLDTRRMQKIEIQQKERKRIYFVEFLRIFLILTVFLFHLGLIDTEMKKSILEFFGTSKWDLAFAVQPFFIIGGFFLYGRLAKEETVNVFSGIGKLWMRLMPGIIFCFTLLVILGVRDWWQFPFCFFPSADYGLPGGLVGCSDWFVGVYFATCCLFTALFAASRQSAWIPICILMLVCWCTQMYIKPNSGLMSGGLYYGILTPRFATAMCCMGLGMVAGYLSAHWTPRVSVFLRLVATGVEGLALFMLFNFMYRTSLVHYRFIAVHLATAALLISAAHGWGYISAFLNRFSGVMYVSRYTYSLLLIQGMLVVYFRVNHNFGMDAHVCSLIILCASVPLILIEYHIIEKWLTPAIKRRLTPSK